MQSGNHQFQYLMEWMATSALSLIICGYLASRNCCRQPSSLDWLATAANASCLTMSSSSSFSMHSLIMGQNSSTPICPKMKQTSCLSRLHWLLQCCLVRSRQRVRMAYLLFLFRSRYISRYFSNRLSLSDSNRPSQEWASYSAASDFEAIRDWSSAQLKGAAGSIVRWQSSPQCFFNSLCFSFSMAIMQVQWSYGQGDSRYFSQQSMMVGSKQLPRAQAASCLDSAFSVSSAILLIRKSLTSPYCSSLSWPSAQSSSCLSRTELPQRGQASINVLMASSLPMFFSWKIAKQRALIAEAGLNRVSLQSVCIPVVDAGLSKNIIWGNYSLISGQQVLLYIVVGYGFYQIRTGHSGTRPLPQDKQELRPHHGPLHPQIPHNKDRPEQPDLRAAGPPPQNHGREHKRKKILQDVPVAVDFGCRGGLLVPAV